MTAPAGRGYGILYLIGPDRVGILQEASAFLSHRGGHIEEGISHTLASEAVVLLHVSGDTEQIEHIARDAHRLGESLKLLSLFTRLGAKDPVQIKEALPLTLRVSSPDFVGLLAGMTQFFSKHGLPIIAHHLQKSALPKSMGSFTYRHRFTVLLPPEFKRKQFIAELDELANRLKFIRDDISHSDFY